MWSQCYNVIPTNFRSQKMGKIRHSFTAREKLKVISYAEAHGNPAVQFLYNFILNNTYIMNTSYVI